MILIGSRALALRAPYCLNRKPVDFDFVCTLDDYNFWVEKNIHKIINPKQYDLEDGNKKIIEGKNSICEFDIIKSGSSNELLFDLVKNDKETFNTSFGMVPNLDLLYTIKMSHRFKKTIPQHFWKTVQDIFALKSKNCTIRPEYEEFYKIRKKESYGNKKFPNLNVSKEKFFSGDGVQYSVDHDSIHESQKTFDRPAYTYYMKADSEVMWDKEKFFSLPREIQLAGCVEEVSVITLERFDRANRGYEEQWKNPKKAWLYGLMRLNFGIVSGSFRDFLYDNIIDVIKLYPSDYVEKFDRDLASGKIKKIKS